MCDALKAITQTMGKVIGGINLPVPTRAVVRGISLDAVGSQVPHLGVAVCDVLLHSQESLAGLVFAVAHVAELGQVVLDGLVGVLAAVTWRRALFATSLEFYLGI
jgi:hypothetical protein